MMKKYRISFTEDEVKLLIDAAETRMDNIAEEASASEVLPANAPAILDDILKMRALVRRMYKVLAL